MNFSNQLYQGQHEGNDSGCCDILSHKLGKVFFFSLRTYFTKMSIQNTFALGSTNLQQKVSPVGIIDEFGKFFGLLGDINDTLNPDGDLIKFIKNSIGLLGCATCLATTPVLPDPICIAQCAATYGPQLVVESVRATLFIMRQISKVCSVQMDDKECGFVVNDCLEGLINIPLKNCNPLVSGKR